MKILAGIISIMIVVLFNVLFKKLLRKEKITIGIIRQPYMYFLSGVFISLMSVILTVVLYFVLSGSFEEFLVFAIFFLSMSLIGFWLIWYYLSFKITISDDHFTYRNFWFKTKKYLYKDCFIVYRRARIDIYFKNKRIIKLGFFINNYSELTDKLESKFIPKKKKI